MFAAIAHNLRSRSVCRRCRTIENPSSRFSSQFERTIPTNAHPSLPVSLSRTSSCSFPFAAYSSCSSSGLPKITSSLITHILRGTATIRPSWQYFDSRRQHTTTAAALIGRPILLGRDNSCKQKTRLAQLPKIHTAALPTLTVLFCTHHSLTANVRVRFQPKEFSCASRYHITSNCFGAAACHTPLPNGCFGQFFFYFRGQ